MWGFVYGKHVLSSLSIYRGMALLFYINIENIDLIGDMTSDILIKVAQEVNMKKLLFVSHCILNAAAKVATDEADLAEEFRQRDLLLDAVKEKGVYMIQLPCPEFIMYGAQRWGHVKNQFMHPHFKHECAKMLEPVLMQIEEYKRYPEEFNIIGIVSVEGSPSCGMNLTCRGEWGGEFCSIEETEAKVNGLEMVNEPGVMMELLRDELSRRGLEVQIVSIENATEMITTL